MFHEQSDDTQRRKALMSDSEELMSQLSDVIQITFPLPYIVFTLYSPYWSCFVYTDKPYFYNQSSTEHGYRWMLKTSHPRKVVWLQAMHHSWVLLIPIGYIGHKNVSLISQKFHISHIPAT